MATQIQKSDIVSHIRQATTDLLNIVDRLEVLDTSLGALGLDSAGGDPLTDADMVKNNAWISAQQMFDAAYALRLVQGYVNVTIDRATLEKIRMGW